MTGTRKYDSTIARIAGNLMSGYVEVDDKRRQEAVQRAVAQAREIVAETERTQVAIDAAIERQRQEQPF